jgi:hypothetical protein
MRRWIRPEWRAPLRVAAGLTGILIILAVYITTLNDRASGSDPVTRGLLNDSLYAERTFLVVCTLAIVGCIYVLTKADD